MASIDHTCIVWKNGVYIPYHELDHDLLPFGYGRDGNIVTVCDSHGNLVDIHDSIKWYRDEYDAVYQRSGIKRIYNHWNVGSILNLLKWQVRWMDRLYYEKEVGVYKCGDVNKFAKAHQSSVPEDFTEIYIYHDAPRMSYASFYRDGTDTYIILGGYGHRENVYCHFMSRGYGEEFEEKMASEALGWLCERVLQVIAESLTDNFDDEDELLERLQSIWDPDYVKDASKRW